MKKILSLLCFCNFAILTYSQYYYYYYDQKISLSLNTSYIYICSYTATNTNQLNNIIGSNFDITSSGLERTSDSENQLNTEKDKTTGLFKAEIRIKGEISQFEYFDLIDKLKKLDGINYAAPCFSTIKGKKMDVSHLFYVKLKSPNDLSQLQALTQQTKSKILHQNKFMPQWYTLVCDKNSSGNALDVANQFYESGKFATAEPGFFNSFRLDGDCSACGSNCDPDFSIQWGLQNTGQAGGTSGVDINACPAWGITTGSPDVIIAIIDDGVQLTHPDLAANIPTTGFDATSGAAGSVGYTESGNDPNHATGCAGIVAAVQNNSIGISGVAPTSSIVSVSMNFATSSITVEIAANAINWAWNEGHASVISNSYTAPVSSYITDAINKALTNGRGGLGSVVVFSAGNDNTDVEYPANLYDPSVAGPQVLSVGGIDRCGARAGLAASVSNACDPWPNITGEDPGSNFGNNLAVVGPGTDVATCAVTGQGTGGGDYLTAFGVASSFGGTSAACPFVAGVAALILSKNPCLTNVQVSNIIETTCSKVDSLTSYSTTFTQGSWSYTHGFGLVDAYAALNFANTTYLQNIAETSTATRDNLGNVYAGYDVNTNISPGNYIISSGADITIKSPTNIFFEPGFVADAGGILDAFIAPFTGDCGPWSPISKMDISAKALTNEFDTLKTTITSFYDNNLIYISPNPFAHSFQLRFNTIGDQTGVAISIFDITGRLVFSDKEIVVAGNHDYSIPVNASASLFFVRVCLNDNCMINKIIKI